MLSIILSCKNKVPHFFVGTQGSGVGSDFSCSLFVLTCPFGLGGRIKSASNFCVCVPGK